MRRWKGGPYEGWTERAACNGYWTLRIHRHMPRAWGWGMNFPMWDKLKTITLHARSGEWSY